MNRPEEDTMGNNQSNSNVLIVILRLIILYWFKKFLSSFTTIHLYFNTFDQNKDGSVKRGEKNFTLYLLNEVQKF